MSSSYRRVKISKDGAGNVFAAAGLGIKGIVGAAGANLVGAALVEVTLGGEAVLKLVPEGKIKMN